MMAGNAVRRAACGAVVAIIALLGMSVASAQTNLVANPGMETGCVAGITTLTGAALPGWNVSAGDAQLVNTAPFVAHSGSCFVDVPGGLPSGTMQQAIPTTVGETYLVTFYATRTNGECSNGALMTASAGSGSTNTASIPAAPGGSSTAPWYVFNFPFVASATSTTLSFTGTNGNSCGIGLDDVSVVVTPKTPLAAVMPLLALALPLLGVFAIWRRRRHA